LDMSGGRNAALERLERPSERRDAGRPCSHYDAAEPPDRRRSLLLRVLPQLARIGVERLEIAEVIHTQAQGPGEMVPLRTASRRRLPEGDPAAFVRELLQRGARLARLHGLKREM